MKNILSNKRVVLGLRAVIGGIFIYAGILKLVTPAAFADSIASFQILPIAFINLLALSLPPVEIMAGVMMISGWRYQSATLCILLLTITFAFALMQALIRGLEVDCGCFGGGEPSTLKTWLSLGRDVLLMFGSILIYMASAKKDSRNKESVFLAGKTAA